MKKKILYIGGFKLPDGNAAAQRVIGNAKALEKLGYEVVFMGVSETKLRSPFESFGFKSYEIKYPTNTLEWIHYISSIKEVSKIVEKESPDILILYNYPSIQTLRLMRICKANNIRIYGDITEWYQTSGYSLNSVAKRIDTFLRMRMINFYLSGLIVISEYLANYYSKSFSSLVNVPPLINKDLDVWKISSIKSKSCINFVYAGSPGLGGKDELSLVVKFFNLAKLKSELPLKLKIIGITKEQYSEVFGQKVQDLESVYFLGRLQHIETLKIIKDSHFSVFFRKPTLVNNAGFPTKFVEAISLGTPVITNSTSDIRRYFNKYPNKLGFLIDNIYDEDKTIECFLTAINSVKDKTYFDKADFCKNSNIFSYENFPQIFEQIF